MDGKKTSRQLKAIALAYKNKETLPEVLVSGHDELARLITEIARNCQVPIAENSELISLLDKQHSGPILSERALKVLAEVVACLYHADNLRKAA